MHLGSRDQRLGFLSVLLGTLVLAMLVRTGGTHFRAVLLNDPPTVNAGSGQTIVLPGWATLDGTTMSGYSVTSKVSLNATVTDDGLPTNGTLTQTWSKLSGPGRVTFQDPYSVDTQAAFAQTGTYVLRLVASDSQLTGTGTVTITVLDPDAADSALKHVYKLNESSGTVAQDSVVSNSANATTVNAPPWVSGRFDNALTFNGTNRYAIAHAPSYSLATPYTLSAFVKTSSSQSGVILAVSNSGSLTDQWGLGMDVSGRPFMFGTRNTVLTSNDAMNDGTWHLVSARLTGSGGGTVYVDGASKSSGAASTIGDGSHISTITIGAISGNNGNAGQIFSHFNGSVDDVRLYHRLLSVDEVDHLKKITSFVSLSVSPTPSTISSGVTLRAYISPATATGTITFTDSGVTLGTASVGHGSGSYTSALFTTGNHWFSASYGGNSITWDSQLPFSVKHVVNKISTSTSLSASPNPSGSGSAVTLTASIVPSTATGTFTFYNSGASLGTASVGHGSGRLVVSSLSPGNHSLTASYGGNFQFAASSSTGVTQRVLSLTTSTLTSSSNPSASGSQVRFTITVSPSNATGSLIFYNSGSTIGSASLGHGSGSFATSALGLGTHSISGRYVGNSTFTGSTTNIIRQKVIPLSVTTLNSSLNPSSSGATVTFTATITPSIATGSIIFSDSGSTLSTVSVGHGSGRLVTSSLTVGTHPIVATYSGSSNHAGSTSNTISQVVTLNQPPTVDAGLGSTITLSQTATLDGTATDDGLPVGSSLTPTWSKQSGPGMITFGNIHSVDTTAAFSQTGTYVLLLSVTDSQYTVTDTVTVTVNTNPITDLTLLHYYKLDDGAGSTFADAVTNNPVALTRKNSPTSISGAFGTAYSFNGTTQYADASAAPTYVLTAPYTMTAWVKTSASSGTGVALSVTNSGSSVNHWGIGVKDGKALAFGTRFAQVVGTGSIADNTWHFIAASTSTGGVVTLSVDGHVQMTGSLVVPSGAVTRIVLGAIQATGSSATVRNFFNGGIDDARLYGRALSVSEIANLMKSPSTTALASTPNPSIYGNNATFTATITPSTATGSVYFTESGTSLGSTTLGHGSGRLVTSSLAIGYHNVVATYSGNSLLLSSYSIPIAHRVIAITSTASILSSLNPSTYGQLVTFSGYVVPSNATGNIRFIDSGTTLSTVSLGHGSGSYSTAALAVGTHYMRLYYAGDATHSSGTSSLLLQVVNAVASSSSSSAGGGASSSSQAPAEHGGGRGHQAGITSVRLVHTVAPAGPVSGVPGAGVRGQYVARQSLHMAAPFSLSFNDVDPDAWFAAYVSDLVGRKIVSGYKDPSGINLGIYRPEGLVTVAEITKIALRAVNAKVIFYTEAQDPSEMFDWSYPYTHFAKRIGLSLFNDPALDVHRNATRGEVVQMLLEVFKVPLDSPQEAPFDDVSLTSRFVRAIGTAARMGMVSGDTDEDGNPLNTFRPNASVNRAETAKMVSEFLQYMENPPAPPLESSSESSASSSL